MRLVQINIAGLRCFGDRVELSLEDNLTALIGRNDVGKSTVIEAISLLCDEKRKPDASDFSSGSNEIRIEGVFADPPAELMLDAAVTSNLRDELLLDSDGRLVVVRVWKSDGGRITVSTFLRAHQPDDPRMEKLHLAKQPELRNLVDGIAAAHGVNRNENSTMRQAIIRDVESQQVAWEDFDREVKKPSTSTTAHLTLSAVLPRVEIFRADRKNDQGDPEAKSPIDAALDSVLDGFREELGNIADKVRDQVLDAMDSVAERYRDLDPAHHQEQIRPQISLTSWSKAFTQDVFTDDIPMNKRGSGTRRLLLLAFLLVEAERRSDKAPTIGGSRRPVIYAIEEPETALHPEKQRQLLRALVSIGNADASQVVITTHAPGLARELPETAVRLLAASEEAACRRSVIEGEPAVLKVCEELGIIPHDQVRLFVHVEGRTDEQFLHHFSRAMFEAGRSELDHREALQAGRIVVLLGGGSSLEHAVGRLRHLRRRSLFVADSDGHHRNSVADRVKRRTSSDETSFTWRRYSIESYVPLELVAACLGLPRDRFDGLEWNPESHSLPRAVASELKQHRREEEKAFSSAKIKGRVADRLPDNAQASDWRQMAANDEVVELLETISSLMTDPD